MPIKRGEKMFRNVVKTITVKVKMPEEDVATNKEIEGWFDMLEMESDNQLKFEVTKISKGRVEVTP